MRIPNDGLSVYPPKRKTAEKPKRKRRRRPTENDEE